MPSEKVVRRLKLLAWLIVCLSFMAAARLVANGADVSGRYAFKRPAAALYLALLGGAVVAGVGYVRTAYRPKPRTPPGAS